jgi:3-phosphoshikimate 1-carboxyvinyltransferase
MAGYPPFLDLPPLARARGSVQLPGSKSISNRTLLLAALAQGVTEVHDLLASDDVDRMLGALEALGVVLEAGAGPGALRVRGCAGAFPVKRAELFLGNAGTAFRPLTAALALSGGHYRLSGAPRMHERPIGDLVDALRQAGAQIRYLGRDGFPPLEILPGEIRVDQPLSVRGEVSSQFLTALLMALPLTGRSCEVRLEGELISKPYVEITLNLMARFGLTVDRRSGDRFFVPAGRYASPGAYHVEGDASSASYFLAAGAIGGGPVRVLGVGRDSIQGDVRFTEALQALGAGVAFGDNWIEARAPEAGGLKAFDLDLNHIPDAAMTLAVVALFTDGACKLRNIASWRVKETDRIAAMAAELRKVGAEVEEGPDYLAVIPPLASRLSPLASIHTYDDHRIAMCFSLVALAGVPIRINDPGCVAKTFPDYFERFAQVTVPAGGQTSEQRPMPIPPAEGETSEQRPMPIPRAEGETSERRPAATLAAGVPVIAIDGPSASGKGTVAHRVAEALGFQFLDSGALYRLVALQALRAGVDLDDQQTLAAVARDLDCGFQGETVLLRGEPVSEALRTEEVSTAASRVAGLRLVRAALLERQRAFRQAPGLVADGRDMGSVVFPQAPLKVFLTASPEERARRRHKQLMEKGIDARLPTLLQDINERDARDASREVAPLVLCEDARVLDTTGLSVDQATQRVLDWFEELRSK